MGIQLDATIDILFIRMFEKVISLELIPVQ